MKVLLVHWSKKAQRTHTNRNTVDRNGLRRRYSFFFSYRKKPNVKDTFSSKSEKTFPSLETPEQQIMKREGRKTEDTLSITIKPS